MMDKSVPGDHATRYYPMDTEFIGEVLSRSGSAVVYCHAGSQVAEWCADQGVKYVAK